MIRITAMLLGVAVAACSADQAPGEPAPVGDRAVLEKLAVEYDKLAEKVPMSPRGLAPAQRKDFLSKVFAGAGYSYSATLHQMAQGNWNPNDQNTKDLVDLLFMPHTDLRPDDSLSGVYNEQELTDVRKVQKMLSQ